MAPARKAGTLARHLSRGDAAKSVIRYCSNDEVAKHGEPQYKAYSLIVRLRLTGKRVELLQELVEGLEDVSKASAAPDSPKDTASSQRSRTDVPPPLSLTPLRSAAALSSPTTLSSIETGHESAPFQRIWTDETQKFSIRQIRATLRSSDEEVPELGPKYHWFSDAVPVDALFPPGIALSAKEILAYYPHHVRWKGVMLRLTANDYRGGDIMGIQEFFRGPPTHKTTLAQMNNYQRDTVKGTIPDFKTIGYKGMSTRELYTDGLAHGHCVDQSRGGLVVPSFDDLIRGLQQMPTGLDARCLTQCLEWYIENQNTFNPKLELNVLHTQALYRALRQPLKPFGPQNLDRNALKEWQDNGAFERTSLRIAPPPLSDVAENGERDVQNSQLRVNVDAENVELSIKLPLRHVLTFPFLALQNMVSEIFKMGINKAEARRAEREGEHSQQPTEPHPPRPTRNKDVCMTPGTTPEVASDEDGKKQEKESAVKKEPYRIPKRPRPIAESISQEPPLKRHQSASQTQYMNSGSHVPTDPRLTHPYDPRNQLGPLTISNRPVSAQHGSPLSSVFGPNHYPQPARRDTFSQAQPRDQSSARHGHQVDHRRERSDPSFRSNVGRQSYSQFHR